MQGKSFSKVWLFCWKPEASGNLQEALRAAGYQVLFRAREKPPTLKEIEQSSAVAVVRVIDPPADYARVIGTLPKGVVIDEHADAPATVTLWFVEDADTYRAALPARRRLAASTRLWILWRKGRRDGLNGNVIREGAMSLGLVDYKICSLNAVWSGMAFAVKTVGR